MTVGGLEAEFVVSFFFFFSEEPGYYRLSSFCFNPEDRERS